jgi:hypothetical protein
MRTPDGKECPQYYEDFHRGRNEQTCRLAERNPDSATWQPRDCVLCTVPAILQANASPDLRLKLAIKKGILGFGRRVEVEATCDKHRVTVADPIVGCPQCNSERPGFDAFLKSLEGG